MDDHKFPIPLFKPFFRVDECLNLIKTTLDQGWTGHGGLTEEFEHRWSQYVGRENTLMLNSASAALHLAIQTLKLTRGWEDNSEIISTPLTFISTNHAIFWNNLNPVLIDVDDDLCMSPEALIKNITAKTKAVIFVSMGGGIGQLSIIEEICARNNLALIIDAAHAAGSRENGIHLGKKADAICYSFQAVKNLPTGDSGLLSMLLIEEHVLAKKLSWLGISESTFARTKSGTYKWDYEVENIGFKYNANAVMGALAIVGLKYLDQDNDTRRALVANYEELLFNTKNVEVVPQTNSRESSRHLFQIYTRDRIKLAEAMSKAQIGFGVHYKTNCAYPMYKKFLASTPNATKFSKGIVSLPLFIEMTFTQQEKIISVLHEALN